MNDQELREILSDSKISKAEKIATIKKERPDLILKLKEEIKPETTCSIKRDLKIKEGRFKGKYRRWQREAGL